MKPTDAKAMTPDSTPQQWMADATVKTYRRGQTIIEAGSELGEWVAISSGAACLIAKVAGSTNIAVAALWLGDVIGWNSPLGKLAARYEVNALVDVVTINIPRTQLAATPTANKQAETALLHAATETRLQDQISMRLAGNGFQRLVSVLATLARALAPPPMPTQQQSVRMERRLALPVAQSCIGQLSGLSRRQTWIYLGQLADVGWVTTSRSKVVLEGIGPWLELMAEVELNGLGCIATVELCSETLGRLGNVHAVK